MKHIYIICQLIKEEPRNIMEENITKPVVFARKKLQRTGFLNTFTLKIIAIICMTIDHLGVCLGTVYEGGSYFLSGFMSYNTYTILRIIGRIAFPIFCYLIVEGFFHTRNVLNYIIRLFVFALISEIPFSLLNRGTPFSFYQNLNVFFTLAIGLITITAMEYGKTQCKNKVINKPILLFICLVVIICATTFADTINCDYAGYGVLVIVIFYVFKDKPLLITAGLLIATLLLSNELELYGLLAMIPIVLHNHQKGPSMKYVFYSYYPVHMVVIYLIAQAVL